MTQQQRLDPHPWDTQESREAIHRVADSIIQCVQCGCLRQAHNRLRTLESLIRKAEKERRME